MVAFRSRDGVVTAGVAGHVGSVLPACSLFDSVEASSQFFAAGACGWSVTDEPGRFDGLELRTAEWAVSAFDVERVHSSFFDDEAVFPHGPLMFATTRRSSAT